MTLFVLVSTVSGLSARHVRPLVSHLGGAPVVARAFGLAEDAVQAWLTDGLLDGDMAKVLATMAAAKVRKPGPRPRRRLMSVDEVVAAIHRHGGYTNAALTLDIAPSSLRRYARGTSTPPAQVCEALCGPPKPRPPAGRAKELIRRAGGRRHVASELGVSYVTVRAWAIGLTTPSAEHQQGLLHLASSDSLA